MKNRIPVAGLMLLLAGIAGCGDSPRTAYHEALVLRNELADTMRQTYDDYSAEWYLETKIKRLEDKWKNLEGRAKPVFDGLGSTKEKEHALDVFVYFFLDEYLETELRIKQEVRRLEQLANQSQNEPSGGNKLKNMIRLENKFHAGSLWRENPFTKRQAAAGFPGGGFPGGP